MLRLNSGSHRLYRFRVTYARVSSTCKETHIRAYEARTRYPNNIHTHINIRVARRGWEYVCRYTEYLALSIQRKGITYYRRLPARRTLIYCYPVRISCGKKRMPANPRPTLQRRSLRGFHPLPVVDRCFTSGRLSFALITFPSGARLTSFTIFIILRYTRSIRYEYKYLNRRNSILLYPTKCEYLIPESICLLTLHISNN